MLYLAALAFAASILIGLVLFPRREYVTRDRTRQVMRSRSVGFRDRT